MARRARLSENITQTSWPTAEGRLTDRLLIIKCDSPAKCYLTSQTGYFDANSAIGLTLHRGNAFSDSQMARQRGV